MVLFDKIRIIEFDFLLFVLVSFDIEAWLILIHWCIFIKSNLRFVYKLSLLFGITITHSNNQF